MESSDSNAQYKKKRVAAMKKAIVTVVLILIIIPIILCIILFVKITKIENKLNTLMAYTQSVKIETQKSAAIGTEMAIVQPGTDGTDGALNNENVDTHEYVAEASEVVDDDVDVKKVYLTFDDGPSDNTDAILDILDQYHVKATFFVIEKTDEASVARYNRIVKEGHTLGMHSTSHKYMEIYSSLDAYVKDVSELRNYLHDVTGYIPTIYRFPGGSSNTVSTVSIGDCIDYLNNQKITFFDWNIASGDASGGVVPSDTIVSNVISGVENHDSSVVLMHDANNKGTTVEALPMILQQLTEMGVKVLPITENTTPVHHKINY